VSQYPSADERGRYRVASGRVRLPSAELDPAVILSFKSNDLDVAPTPEARKLSLLLLLNPVHPIGYERFGCFKVEIKSEAIVG
jgi:hypothetical protein